MSAADPALSPSRLNPQGAPNGAIFFLASTAEVCFRAPVQARRAD